MTSPVDPVVSPSAEADTMAATVAASVANATSRYLSHQADTYGQGSQIGATMALPDVVSDHSRATGGDGAGYPA